MSSSVTQPPLGKQNFEICYLCGGKFGTASIGIHEPKCLEKWKQRNKNLPVEERMPIPKKPKDGEGINFSEMSLEERNDAKFKHFNDNLPACPNCARTFLPDRLVVHLKSCKTADGKLVDPATVLGKTKSGAKDSSGGGAAAVRGKFVICYICGREFTTASLPIHEPQCEKKFLDQQQLLPKEQRRKLPKKPEAAASSNIDIQRQAAEEAQQATLAPCPHCGRTFNPERLPVHLRSCKPSAGSKPVKGKEPSPVASGAGLPTETHFSKTVKKPNLVVCYICGREFTSKSLPIHEPQCATKFKAQQDLLPPEQRKSLPKKPSALSSGEGLTNEERNAIAAEAHASSLSECPNCGRTFNPDRLPVHLKSCKPGQTAAPVKKEIKSQNQTSTIKSNNRNRSSASSLSSKPTDTSSSPSRPGPTDIDDFVLPGKASKLDNGLGKTISLGGVSKGEVNSDIPLEGESAPVLVPCDVCGRNFASERLTKHKAVCKKLAIKKRTAFDVTKMRVEGTDILEVTSLKAIKSSNAPGGPPKNNWKKKHEEFQQTIKNAKMVSAHLASGGKASDLPPPPRSENSDYIECPFCKRKFAPAPAERHIPKCQNIVSNKRKSSQSNLTTRPSISRPAATLKSKAGSPREPQSSIPSKKGSVVRGLPSKGSSTKLVAESSSRLSNSTRTISTSRISPASISNSGKSTGKVAIPKRSLNTPTSKSKPSSSIGSLTSSKANLTPRGSRTPAKL
eukprot:Nk52_evm77s2118 gene=Nk52_evmTU77s2118